MKYLFLLFAAFSVSVGAKTCATAVASGPIAERYRALGAGDGPLGCPIGNEIAAGRGGRAQTFEFGTIVTAPSLGASAILSAHQEESEITVVWGPLDGVVYEMLRVRWDLNGRAAGQQELGNPVRAGGRLSIPASSPGQYRVAVQGCFVGRPGTPIRCQGWTDDAVVEVRPLAWPKAADPRSTRGPTANTAVNEASRGPVAQPTARPGMPPSPGGPSNPRPSYSEPGAVPGAPTNANTPAQEYLGSRSNSSETAPPQAAAESEFVRKGPSEAKALAASVPIPVHPPANPNQKFAVYPTRKCTTSPMPPGVYLQEYMRLGGPNGPMGCPVTTVVSIPGVSNGGRVSFQNGSIMTSNGVWPGGVLAAFQQGTGITVDWAVKVGDFSPGYNYDKFIVRWRNVADANNAPQQVDVPAQFRQPEWGDSHLRSQGSYVVGWGGASALIEVTVEGCDNPTYDALKPDPTKSRCLQGWMPGAPVMYMANPSLLPPDDFAFIDFGRIGAHSAASVADSIDQLRSRGAAAILQAACSTLPYSFYSNEESYRNTILAKMLYADYFESDKCPGRNIDNRVEVNDSLRVQRLWGDENAGSTFDGIQPPKLLGDICGPPYNGKPSKCPPFRKGEYDVVLSGLSALLSKYGSALQPDVYHHVLYDLLNKKGPLSPNDLRIDIGGATGSETENHILQITTGQYLTNQLMFAETHDGRYNNAANGMNGFMADFLHGLLTRDFLEYNARPYQDYAVTALQHLYSFTNDLEDAPRNGISSHSVKLGAEMVLDYISEKAALSSDDGRRAPPYRRKAEDDHLAKYPDAHDLLGAKGDAQYPRMLFLAGVGLDQIADPGHGWILGMTNYGWQMVDAAFSSYRLPELILDEMVNRQGRQSIAMFHHSGDEIYWRSSSYMLSAGGRPAPTLYPYTADKNTISLISAAVGVEVGGPIAATLAGYLAPMITSAIQVGDDDARGVAVPTTLIPAGLVRDRDSLLRFEGPSGQNSTNLCVTRDFACGRSLTIPSSYLANRLCSSSRAGVTPGSKWLFLNVSGTCSPLHPWGFFVALWTKDGDGFFEVYERPDEPFTSVGPTQREREQAWMKTTGGAVVQPPSSTVNLTFPEFVAAVWQRNGAKPFSTGTNAGANSYRMLDGSLVSFQVGPDRSVILNQPATSLVSGDSMSSDIPGRITIKNNRLGEELVLDDSRSVAPVRTFRTGLPTNQIQQKERLQ